MDQFIVNQITLAGIAVWVIQRLKASKWAPWLSDITDNANRIVAVVIASLSAAGIIVTYEWSGATGQFSLDITGLTATNVMEFLWKVVQSIVLQEGFYRVVKASQVKAIP